MPSLEYWASLSITLDGLVQQDQLGRPHGRAATLNKFGPSAGGPGRAHVLTAACNAALWLP